MNETFVKGFDYQVVTDRVRAAMYSAALTSALPPKIVRFPRYLPLSRLNGARPAKALIFFRLSCPSSGSRARSMEAFTGPIPLTLLRRFSFSLHKGSFDKRGDILVHFTDAFVEPLYMGLDIGSHPVRGGFQAVPLHGKHLDKLSSPCDEGLEPIGVLILQRPRFRPYDLPEAGYHLCVDAIRLGQPSRCFSEVPYLPGVDYDYGKVAQRNEPPRRGSGIRLLPPALPVRT